MKEVLLSTRPKWCEKIGSREKKAEVRKTRPKEVPFKCYIYCTKTNSEQALLLDKNGRLSFGDYRNADNNDYYIADGKVIGEFICDKVVETCGWRLRGNTQQCAKRTADEEAFPDLACLTIDEIVKYAGGENHVVYGWHISDLKIYDKPKKLSDFNKLCPTKKEYDCENCERSKQYVCTNYLTRPPQSWQYVLDK